MQPEPRNTGSGPPVAGPGDGTGPGDGAPADRERPGTSGPTLTSRTIDRSPVYFGWLVLAAATLGLIMTTPGQTLAVSVFLDRIIADLGLTRSTVSLLYTIGTLTGAVALPFIGRFIDRRGPRVAVVIISSLFAFACAFMGAVGGILTLLIGFILIRSLGQGALSLVSMHAVNIWFVRRRGLAVGLAGLGVALATAAFPLIIEGLIEAVGWRNAYVVLGGVVALVMVPVGAIFFRVHPERYGLAPDGRLAKPEATVKELDYTAAQARRTWTFWLFVSGDFLISMLGTALVFHHYSIMAASGLDRIAAATVFVPFGIATAATNLVTGYLMDRVPPRFLLSTMLLLQTLGLILATHVTSTPLMLVYGALLGITQGMRGTVSASVHAHLFGRKYIGSIKGFVSAMTVAGSSVGPLVVALGFDAFGSYGPILLASATLPLVVAVTAPWLRPYRADGSIV